MDTVLLETQSVDFLLLWKVPFIQLHRDRPMPTLSENDVMIIVAACDLG